MRTLTAVLVSLSLLTGATVGVLAQTSAEEQPDLVPRDLAADPSEPVEGEQTTFTATIENDGEADAEAFNVTFLVDGEVLGENKTVDALRFGDETQVTSDAWTAEGEEAEIRVVVDPHEDVAESNETNNERARTVSVAAAEVDLALVDVDWDAESPVEGENVTFEATVENQGNVSANETQLRFLVDGDTHGEDVLVKALEPGENTTVVSENWTAQAGEHEIQAFVDPAREIDEPEEANNQANETITVDPDEANLHVASIELAPEDPAPGDEATFTATLANDGHQPAENVTLSFRHDDALLSNASLEHLAAGEEVELTSQAWNASEGEHEIRAIADVDGNVTEIDETDNEAARVFSVEALAELAPTELDVPEDAEEGEDVTFEATVANTGEALAENVTVAFLLDGEELSNATIGSLEAGDEAEVTSEAWNASEGNHSLTVTVDPHDDVEERKETNNEASANFTVAQAEEEEHEHEAEEGEETITICHIPPGNPDARHTKEIGKPAWEAHKGHGDHKGPCEDGAQQESADDDAEAEDEADGDEDADPEHEENEGSEDDRREAEGNGHGNGHGNGKARGPP